MAFLTKVALGVAIMVGTASAVPAASPYGGADLADCVANSPPPSQSRDQLDAMATTEYDIKVGRCMQHLFRRYERQPRPAR
jgi:hypothetical protein